MGPIRLYGDQTKPGILLLHGFHGNVVEMKELAHKLHDKNYTVFVPLYPGHGKVSFETFLSTGIQEWYAHVLSFYNELRTQYNQVIVAGLSLGGALTLKIGIDMNPYKMITIAAPVLEFNEEQLYKHTSIEIKNHPEISYEEGYQQLLKMKLDINNFYRSIRENLDKINSSIFICQGLSDHERFINSSTIIHDRVSSIHKKIKTYENVEHVMTMSQKKEEIMQDIMNYIEDK
ncbi:hypothetical protein BK011_09430 [Tenericutes bacterium MZ-XQ]|nr:hypothetical protein BK011_09430 [Tenericutes bacterium MZ-XQ]